jgi:hypothetical protein
VLESLINKFFANYTSKSAGDSQSAGSASAGKGADTQGKAESKK